MALERFRLPPPEARGDGGDGTAAMAYWLDISRSRSAMVRALHDYWSAKRGLRGMPGRDDIDPAEIKTLLPHVLIADLVGDAPRVRYRLVGTRVAAASGFDFTGRHLDEILTGGTGGLWHAYYRIVRDRRLPVLGDAVIPTTDGSRFGYEFGIFPLSPDGETVTQCLSIEDYGKVNGRLDELLGKVQKWEPRDGARRAAQPPRHTDNADPRNRTA